MTITGTATDSGGGVVAGVEISTDGGSTWHPAKLTSPTARRSAGPTRGSRDHSPSTTIKTRAIDDSGNLETPSGGDRRSTSAAPARCGATTTPPTADSTATPASVEVGIKFTSDSFGQISGIRFYKAATNTGTHVGSLWTASGTLLASATFTGETAVGLADGRTSPARSRSCPTRRMSPGTSRRTATTPRPTTTSIRPRRRRRPAAATRTARRCTRCPTTPASTGCTPTARREHVPDQQLRRQQLLGRRQLHGEPATRAGDERRQPRPASSSANVTWTAPELRRHADDLHGHPVHRLTRADAHHRQRPPRDRGDDHEPDAGHGLHLQGAGVESEWQRPSIGASNSVTPTGPTAPAAPTGVTANPATGQAQVSWTAPQNNGSAITGYTITPFIGSTAQTPVQVLERQRDLARP